MFWIALAAQVTSPVAERPGTLFTVDDIPQYLLRAGPGAWRVPVRIAVAPDGKVRRCDIEASSGIADLNRLTCRILSRRARFQPARIDGVPTFGVYRTSILWAVADAPWDTSKTRPADIEVTVERLPAGLDSPTFVKVSFAVDAGGKISSCVAGEIDANERVNNHPALVPVACEQVVSGYRATPAIDDSGQPVLSVQNALVRFSGATSN